VPEEAVGPFSVPLADHAVGRTGPDGGASTLEPLLLALEARPGGDVRLAVTVGVERLPEAEAELTLLDAAGKAMRDAPAGCGSGAAWGARQRGARNREAAE